MTNQDTMHESPSPAMTEEIGDRAFQQFMDIFITPAVTARQSAGELPTPLPLRAAQIIFHPDGRRPLVRINDEVEAEVTVVPASGALTPGEPVYEHQVGEIESIRLLGDDVDCGHVTIIRINGRWRMHFDFRYNRSLAREHLDRAKEFCATAKHALEAGRSAAFVDTLFSASELAAKSFLLSVPDPRMRKKTKHQTIHSRFNRHANIGRVSPDHRAVFNDLADLRRSARYLDAKLQLDNEQMKVMLQKVEELIEQVDDPTLPRSLDD